MHKKDTKREEGSTWETMNGGVGQWTALMDPRDMMSFDRGLEGTYSPYDITLTIRLQIYNVMVIQVLIDSKLEVSVHFKEAVDRIGLLNDINNRRAALYIVNATMV